MSDSRSSKTQERPAMKTPAFRADANSAVVRYQVRDLDRAADFYTRYLGFDLVARPGPVAIIRRGDLRLVLSGPGSSGSRPIPDGREQEPGGWNRIVLYFDDLDPIAAAVRETAADPGDRLDNVVRRHVRNVVHVVSESKPVLSHLVEESKLKAVGARYDLDTGEVEILK